MRILITNDDGITAPGLKVAEEIAANLVGPDGDVWVVAPAFEQSGVAHCVSYVRPMRLEQLDAKRFAVEGSPADCVLAGVCEILADDPPDLVLSGVNRGHNVAEDILYSGTVGGAMEGALHGIRSIGLSQYYGPRDFSDFDQFDAAKVHGSAVVEKLVAKAKWKHGMHNVFYNVNFPPIAGEKVNHTIGSFQGKRPGPTFGVKAHEAPNGRKFLWLTHGHGNVATQPGSDARESHDGQITVTPLVADLTAHELVDTVTRIFE